MDLQLLNEPLLFFSFTKDFWVSYGINTELFQCGSEFRSKMPLSIPWKFAAKINVREKKFELDFPPCKKEYEVVSIRYLLGAVEKTDPHENHDSYLLQFRIDSQIHSGTSVQYITTLWFLLVMLTSAKSTTPAQLIRSNTGVHQGQLASLPVIFDFLQLNGLKT